LTDLSAPLTRLARYGPERWYAAAMGLLIGAASLTTRLLQNGRLSRYLRTILISAIALIGYPLALLVARSGWELGGDLRLSEVLMCVLILAGAATAISTTSRLTAVAALGVVGFGMALLFLFFGAPDLAMTQFAIEALTVILFVLVIYKLPQFGKLSPPRVHWRDAVIAAGTGALMTFLTLAVLQRPLDPLVAKYYAASSALLAHGRNVVNVILVDFRALDTLGEITVLAVAGLGGYALIRLRLAKRGRP
jgi:multicomponent Na+:H+ antiporter subunit A